MSEYRGILVPLTLEDRKRAIDIALAFQRKKSNFSSFPSLVKWFLGEIAFEKHYQPCDPSIKVCEEVYLKKGDDGIDFTFSSGKTVDVKYRSTRKSKYGDFWSDLALNDASIASFRADTAVLVFPDVGCEVDEKVYEDPEPETLPSALVLIGWTTREEFARLCKPKMLKGWKLVMKLQQLDSMDNYLDYMTRDAQNEEQNEPDGSKNSKVPGVVSYHTAYRCPLCFGLVMSTRVHDFVACACWEDSDGKTGIAVDGGMEYAKISATAEALSIGIETVKVKIK